MTQMESDDLLQQYHTEYCKQTGLPLRCSIGMYYPWGLFAKEFALTDIKVVVDHLRRIYRDQPSILRASLRWSYLIEERGHFREFLAEALAEARKPKATAREKALASIGHPAVSKDGLKTAARVIKDLNLLPDVAERQDPTASPPPTFPGEAPAALPIGQDGDSQDFMAEHQKWKSRRESKD